MGTVARVVGLSLLSQADQKGAALKKAQPGHEPESTWDDGVANDVLTHSATMFAPKTIISVLVSI